MSKRHQIRGDKDTLFYARTEGERDMIYMLALSHTTQNKLESHLIYELDNRLIALQQKFDYRELKDTKILNQFYILDTDKKLYSLC